VAPAEVGFDHRGIIADGFGLIFGGTWRQVLHRNITLDVAIALIDYVGPPVP